MAFRIMEDRATGGLARQRAALTGPNLQPLLAGPEGRMIQSGAQYAARIYAVAPGMLVALVSGENAAGDELQTGKDEERAFAVGDDGQSATEPRGLRGICSLGRRSAFLHQSWAGYVPPRGRVVH